MSLQDYTNKVERLAQVAYGNLDIEDWRTLAFEAFPQSLNNLGLQRHHLAAGVETIEATLKQEKAYFQAQLVP